MELTKQQIEQLRKDFAVVYGSEEYYEGLAKIRKLIMKDKEPVQNPTMTLLGGQQGSGKTQLLISGQNDVRLSLDECTRFHPKLKDMVDFPDLFAYLTYETGLIWRNELYNELVQGKYNVITEGTLRDEEGTVKLIEDLRRNGYAINVHVMATGIAESGISVFERYEDEIKSGIQFPRLTECMSSYLDIPKTIKRIEDEKLCDSIKIFTRGEGFEADLVHDSNGENNNYRSAYECLLIMRELDNIRAMKSFGERYEEVKGTMKRRNATSRETMQLENFRASLFRDFVKLQTYLSKGGKDDGRAY